jgi:hypothetical protein
MRLTGVTLLLLTAGAGAQKSVPRMQAVPQPDHQVSFQRDGVEIARYHFSRALRRPFVFPVIGPSGRVLTRMGHPHDPEGHSHHNSVWISHTDVNGVNFWADGGGTGRILHQRIERLDDGAEEASVETQNTWTADSSAVVLTERRRIAVRALPRNELLLVFDLQLEAGAGGATFAKTPFGLIGVRMAKTIGVNDGGGEIRNSEGASDEPAVLWKRAKWVDYSGPVAPGAVEGITLMDHPANPNHPTFFHVRRDGWMGSSFSYDEPRSIPPGKPVRLRYGLFVHAGAPSPAALEERWKEFARTPLPELAGRKSQ